MRQIFVELSLVVIYLKAPHDYTIYHNLILSCKHHLLDIHYSCDICFVAQHKIVSPKKPIVKCHYINM